jgi:hypothetical protein
MKCRGTGVEPEEDNGEREVMPRLKDEEGCG